MENRLDYPLKLQHQDFKTRQLKIFLPQYWRRRLRLKCIKGVVLLGEANDPDPEVDNALDDYLHLFAYQDMVVVDQGDDGVRGLLDGLDQIGVEIKFGVVEPGQFDHSD